MRRPGDWIALGRRAWPRALRGMTILWLALATLGMAAAGSAEETTAEETTADKTVEPAATPATPVEHRVDVGGHTLRAQILGGDNFGDSSLDDHRLDARQPTVVFDTGMGDGLDRWGPVPFRVAAVARVVLYDRAGYGESELGPTPRTAEQVADELHALLVGLELEPPFVLVGHSLAGIHLRAFADRFPDAVAGLVFLDVTIEGMFESLFTDEGRAHYESLVADYPPGLRDEGLGFYHKLVALPTFQVPEPPVPTVVVTAAAEPHIPPEAQAEAEAAGITVELLREQRELKLELGATLAEKFSARHVLAHQSGHYVHHDEPDLVTAEILAILEAVRSGGHGLSDGADR